MSLTVTGVHELAAMIGTRIGPSDWRIIGQSEINRFADLTGDTQWIHVDEHRALTESPWGGTIAHGLLVLSVVAGLRGALLNVEGVEFSINRGWRNVVFLGHVAAGAAVRVTSEPMELSRLDGAWYEFVEHHTAATSTEDVCKAESVTWFLPSE